MRNRLHRYRYNVVLLLATWLVACSKVPDDILSEKKMQAVQVDMQLAEAMINLDSKAFSDNARKEALYQSIFRKYDITQACTSPNAFCRLFKSASTRSYTFI
jgi:hypothetical protein